MLTRDLINNQASQCKRHVAELAVILLVCLMGLLSCKKKGVLEDQPESPTSGSRMQFTLDSIFLYAKHTYLWKDALTDYYTFNPRKYTSASSDLLNFKELVYDLSRPAINPLNLQPYEKTDFPGIAKYSYIAAGTGTSGNVAAVYPRIADQQLAAALTDTRISGHAAYLALTEFAHLNTLKPILDQAFVGFADAGVTTLVVDLRNNSGGYVETAKYLANLMAKPAMNGQVMYSEHFNSEMQQGKASILKKQIYLDGNNQPVYLNGRLATYADVDFSVSGNTYTFEKGVGLNQLSSIYFLVNGSTASASELLINALKPYFNVKLIGSKTYGKPVGSFGIKIDQYTLYVSNFLIKNSRGKGDYFDGMPVDIAADDASLGTGAEAILANTIALASGKTVQRIGYTQKLEINTAPVLPNLMIKETLRLIR
ncbi:S41 family peptidase [Pedobacter sp. GR22-6]|uniref:S41 family peptidase n=1 Tax=Pedobacter sp. GR22-6 TaxID=3127957 RepID=UPI00307FA187